MQCKKEMEENMEEQHEFLSLKKVFASFSQGFQSF